MEHLSLYQLSRGSTPEEGVFFYEDQRLINGLDRAETAQLTLDYEADSKTFEEVVRFSNKYIDELESLAKGLANYRKSAIEHYERSKSYEQLQDFIGKSGYDQYHRRGPSPNNHTFWVANSAAGSYVLNSHHELRDEHDQLTVYGGDFIELMAKYFEDRHLPKSARLNGLEYSFHETALTCTIKDHGQDRVIFFEKSRLSGPEWMAIGEISMAFIRANYPYANAAAGALKKGGQHIKIADIDDWQRLVDGLKLMAQF